MSEFLSDSRLPALAALPPAAMLGDLWRSSLAGDATSVHIEELPRRLDQSVRRVTVESAARLGRVSLRGDSLQQARPDLVFFSTAPIRWHGGRLAEIDLFEDFCLELNLDVQLFKVTLDRRLIYSEFPAEPVAAGFELLAMSRELWLAWRYYVATLRFVRVPRIDEALGADVREVRLHTQLARVADPLSVELARRGSSGPVAWTVIPVFGLRTEVCAIGVGSGRDVASLAIRRGVSLPWIAGDQPELDFDPGSVAGVQV